MAKMSFQCYSNVAGRPENVEQAVVKINSLFIPVASTINSNIMNIIQNKFEVLENTNIAS